MANKQALSELATAVHDPNRSVDEIRRLASSALSALLAARQTTWDPGATSELREAMSAECPLRAGIVANLIGALVESGADPRPAADLVLPRLPALIDQSQTFLDACLNELEEQQPQDDVVPAPEDAGDDEGGVSFDSIAERMADVLPDAGRAWQGLDFFHCPVVAILSSDRSLRRSARDLLPKLQPLATYHGGADWIAKLLAVLDNEPILVLEPGYSRGFVGTMDGVSDNFQLHMLLMDALPEPSWLGFLGVGRFPRHLAEMAKGRGPQQIDQSVAGRWNVYTWQVVGPDGKLPPAGDMGSSQFWVWNEGQPVDIPVFEGRRVIVLGPASYPRFWNACRLFARLPAELKVEQKLTAPEVHQWMQRLANAPRDK